MNLRRQLLASTLFFTLTACTVQQEKALVQTSNDETPLHAVVSEIDARMLTQIGKDDRVLAEWVSLYQYMTSAGPAANPDWSIFRTRITTGRNFNFYAYTKGTDPRILKPGYKLELYGPWYNQIIKGYPEPVGIQIAGISGRVKAATDTLITLELPQQENYIGTRNPAPQSEIAVEVCAPNSVSLSCANVAAEQRVVGTRLKVFGIPDSVTASNISLVDKVRVYADNSATFANRSADINGDQKISPADLQVMAVYKDRYLATQSSVNLLTQREYADIPRLDVNGDNLFSAADILATSQALDRRMNSAITSLFHNAAQPRDINGDGFLTPLDRLNVINASNRLLQPHISSVNLEDYRFDATMLYIDVNGDGFFTALDVLLGTGN